MIIVLDFNNRNYNPGEYTGWYQSREIAHSRTLDSLIDHLNKRYPSAKLVKVPGLS